MALLDEAIDNQRSQYPGGEVELVRRGRRGRGPHHESHNVLEIPQAIPGQGEVAGPPESAAAPRESQMPDPVRLVYDALYRPSNYLFGGKRGPQVAQSLGYLLPLVIAVLTAKYGLSHADRPFNPQELGLPEVEGLERDPMGRTKPLYRPPTPMQQAPGRTIPLGPGGGTGELEHAPFLHWWEEEDEPEEPGPGSGWKH